MKPRVAIIVPGGVGSGDFAQGIPALVDLIEHLAMRYDITVYSLANTDKQYQPIGYKLESLPAFIYPLKWLSAIWLMIRILKDHSLHRFTLFHGFWGVPCGTLAVVLGQLLHRPNIVSLQGGEVVYLADIQYGYLSSEKRKRRLLYTLSRANCVSVLTQFQKQKLLEVVAPSVPIEVVPYGADTSLFSPPDQRKYATPFQLLHVANLTSVKDQMTLLKAFAMIRKEMPCTLRIVGHDDMDGELQQICQTLGITNDVEFLGSIRHSALAEHYRWADVLLHTSKYEAQAVVVAEALASKVVVVGTRVGLLSDLDGMVTTVDVGDDKALAAQCLKLLNHPANMIEKAELGYAWALKKDNRCTAEAFVNLYKKLIGSIS